MTTGVSRSQYLDDQIACMVDSLIFGHLQRKQYSKTLQALLSESPHLTKDATTVPNAPNQIILNVNSFVHDQNLEQIIEAFHTYGRFDVSPNLLELGKKLRELSNEFSSELAFGCHSYSNNEQRLYGRKLRTRMQKPPALVVHQIPFNNQLDANKRAEYIIEQAPQPVNHSAHNDNANLQYSQDMENDEARAEFLSSHEIAHHSRRKAAQPLKQTQRVVQQLMKTSQGVLQQRSSEGVDNTSFLIDPEINNFLELNNFDDIMKSIDDEAVVDDDTLYQTLESVEREAAMESDQNSRDSMNPPGGASLALDIPMHDEHPSTSMSPIARHRPSAPSIPSAPHNTFSRPPPPQQPHIAHSGTIRASRPLMEQYHQQPSMPTANGSYNASLAPAMPPSAPPPPPPPNPPPVDQSKIAGVEPEKKSSRAGDTRETPWVKNGSSPSAPKTRLPPPPPPTSSPLLPPSTSSSSGTAPKLSSLGRIPKKGQSSGPPAIPPSPSPSASPRAVPALPMSETPRIAEGFRMSKGKIAPVMSGNDERRDSLDSQDTLRAESVGESDCTMTENEDNDHPGTRESEKKANWDDLFDDGPSTMETSSRERDRQRESQENRRRMEMREMEKKKEREKRRNTKDKKDDDKRDRSKDDRNRMDRRPVDDRRRDSIGREEREDKDDRQRKRREQEEQKRVIEAQKRQMETEERARQKKKEEEDRRREVKEKDDEKKREKEREMKKMEDEKLKKEREIKLKEEKRNELERRRRREAQLKKTTDKPPMLLDDSPLDKIAAVMDGKELRKENVLETTTRASSRVMEISSGIERNRPFSLAGSLHSSKSGIYLEKAQKLRGDTSDRQPPPEVGRPVRPIRVQMAPMKRPPAAMVEDEESGEDEGESPVQKKGKLEDNKITNILNKLHR